ncbi:MAG: hypothetical protein Q7S73_02220 [bacterium]|nr:hypothetical protein [bacterium]
MQKKKSFGRRFGEALWKKLTKGCKPGKWLCDEEKIFLKETLKEFKISTVKRDKIINLDRCSCLTLINSHKQVEDILNYSPRELEIKEERRIKTAKLKAEKRRKKLMAEIRQVKKLFKSAKNKDHVTTLKKIIRLNRFLMKNLSYYV